MARIEGENAPGLGENASPAYVGDSISGQIVYMRLPWAVAARPGRLRVAHIRAIMAPSSRFGHRREIGVLALGEDAVRPPLLLSAPGRPEDLT